MRGTSRVHENNTRLFAFQFDSLVYIFPFFYFLIRRFPAVVPKRAGNTSVRQCERCCMAVDSFCVTVAFHATTLSGAREGATIALQ